jgi:hypothetical protein
LALAQGWRPPAATGGLTRGSLHEAGDDSDEDLLGSNHTAVIQINDIRCAF